MVFAVIPARMSSTRFYGKPLALIDGVPMVKRVFLAARDCPWVNGAIIAAEDNIIVDKMAERHIPAMLTPKCATGSDRVWEAVKHMGMQRGIILNIQGDEPLITRHHIRQLLTLFEDNPDVCVGQLVQKIEYDEAKSSDVVKVLFDGTGRVYKFLREMPEGPNIYYGAVGIIGFRMDALAEFGRLEPSYWERHTRVELQRLLDNKRPVHVAVTDRPTIGVDRLDDIKRVEEQL